MRYWRNRLRNRHPGCRLEIGHEDFGPLLYGTWTIASTANSNGNYSIRLNGLAVTEAVNMELWGGGVLYVVNVWGGWYKWQFGAWVGPLSTGKHP